ncbi:MAG TPA: TonB-dependent receptor plug domain-containing protein, partial [Longimicrobiales bacterium]|nr:TonB-dependent receptor plug domain-containing protein [Longimicrobiales bacterium]
KPPLYVVDGMPVRTTDGSLPPIEPQDIDSVRVLKGTETAVWGIDGADGVIVFSTKRGKLRGK